MTVLSFHPRESYPKEALKMASRHQWYQSEFQWNKIAQLGEIKRLPCEEAKSLLQICHQGHHFGPLSELN